MPHRSQTPLAYVMDLLGISGTRLAAEIHIHQSMVSRWKNGTVILTYNTRYFQDIVNTLQEIDDKQGLGTLKHFLASVYGKPMQREDDVHKHLEMWLNGVNFDKMPRPTHTATDGAFYIAEHKVFKGISGKQNALKLFAAALNNQPDATAWGIENGHGRFYDNSPSGKKRQRFLSLPANGPEFKLLFNLNKGEQALFDMYQHWAPVCASSPAQLYYTYSIQNSFFESIYYIKDKMAVISSLPKGDDSNLFTALFDDPYTVRQFEYYGRSFDKGYSPLVKKLVSPDPFSDFKDATLLRHLKTDYDQYAFLGNHPFLIFDKELVEQLIDFFALGPSEIKALQRIQRQSTVFLKRLLAGDKKTRVILTRELVDTLQDETRLGSNFLSRLLGKSTAVPRHIFVRYLHSIVEVLSNSSNCEVALQTDSCPAFFSDMTLWAKENSFVYFYPLVHDDAHCRLLTTEFSSVRSFYANAQQYWEDLPQIAKDPAFIQRQLELLAK